MIHLLLKETDSAVGDARLIIWAVLLRRRLHEGKARRRCSACDGAEEEEEADAAMRHINKFIYKNRPAGRYAGRDARRADLAVGLRAQPVLELGQL